MENAREILNGIRVEGLFTRSQDFDIFVQNLRQRYARVYKEILPNDYDIIVQKLKERGEL